MRKLIFILFLFIVVAQDALSQSNPVVLRPDVTVTALKPAPYFCSGIAFDPISSKLHYTGLNGNVYMMNYPGPLPATDTLLFTVADHSVSILKGLLFRDSVLYLIGNHNMSSFYTYGIIAKGVLQPGGYRLWSVVMETEPYQLGDGPFDHGISGMCFNATGDSLYFNSGSRTDHGEAQENGSFADLREIPLTSAIFKIPANSTNLVLMNDSSLLNPYLFADGVRNTFKMALNANGHLFGCENSGDSDDPDELNYLIEGNHYGFPWVMGGNNTKQQYPSYDPTTDFMINQLRTSYIDGDFYNDPLYPQKPASLVLTNAIQNTGTDADKFRDTISGIVQDASDLGITLGTFTTHRSPLGLVFDNDSLLVWDLKGRGFLFSNQTSGDSLGNAAGGGFGTLLDPGEDMLSINLIYDYLNGTYTLEAKEIITGFTRPVDACIVGTKIYLLEYGRPIEPGTIYEISMPEDLTGISTTENKPVPVKLYPNPASGYLRIEFNFPSEKDIHISICNLYGQTVIEKKVPANVTSGKNHTIDTSELIPGFYFIKIDGSSRGVKFMKM